MGYFPLWGYYAFFVVTLNIYVTFAKAQIPPYMFLELPTRCLICYGLFRSNRSLRFSVRSFGCALFIFWGSSMIVTFCGHSQYRESGEDEQKILSLLLNLIGDHPAKLYLGGYGSFDAFARKCGKAYQKSHPLTKLILVTPYLGSDAIDFVRPLYDDILYPALEHIPPKFAISHRNKWMVEHADVLIAYIDHPWGGAYQSYLYAKRKNKEIHNLTEKYF